MTRTGPMAGAAARDTRSFWTKLWDKSTDELKDWVRENRFLGMQWIANLMHSTKNFPKWTSAKDNFYHLALSVLRTFFGALNIVIGNATQLFKAIQYITSLPIEWLKKQLGNYRYADVALLGVESLRDLYFFYKISFFVIPYLYPLAFYSIGLGLLFPLIVGPLHSLVKNGAKLAFDDADYEQIHVEDKYWKGIWDNGIKQVEEPIKQLGHLKERLKDRQYNPTPRRVGDGGPRVVVEDPRAEFIKKSRYVAPIADFFDRMFGFKIVEIWRKIDELRKVTPRADQEEQSRAPGERSSDDEANEGAPRQAPPRPPAQGQRPPVRGQSPAYDLAKSKSAGRRASQGASAAQLETPETDPSEVPGVASKAGGSAATPRRRKLSD
ncbi:MAG: hypothetical protein ACHQJ6_03825 [Candidatus Berkiellales bacterium]